MDSESLSVTLTPKQWTLVVFLAKQGLVHELNSTMLNTSRHGSDCFTGFLEAFKALHGAIPIQVAENLPQASKTKDEIRQELHDELVTAASDILGGN